MADSELWRKPLLSVWLSVTSVAGLGSASFASTPVVPSSATTVSGADSGLEISGREEKADSTVVEGA